APISVIARWTGLSWSQVDDLTIVHDKATGNVIHVGIGRNTETIDNFYEAWQDHLWALQSVSMDLWPAFISSAKKWLKDADSKICFDRFHIAGFFGKAVDQVRKREHHDLKADGNDLLKGTKYDWLRNGNNLDGRSRRWFIKLSRENLKTSRAWAIKETASMIWKYKSKTWAEKAWRNLFGWMCRSRLSPMVNLAKSLKKHFYGIMNSIMLGIDNGMAESINSKIQKVKKMACGFRNIERFQNAIMFHSGGLDLYPALPTQ
ncbi:MAG TPA: transposase, partial [Fibrobacteraceae bacterium]|nr:transposase [Fibrobacteraceae bacterium]